MYIESMNKNRGRSHRHLRSAEDSGFTLIELLIVIVVLGVLAAVVVFALGGVTSKGAKSACAADAKTVETAIAAYQAQTGNALSMSTGSPTPSLTGITTQAQATQSGLIPSYLKSWPNNSSHYYIGIGMSSATIPATSTEVDIASGTSMPAAGTSWTPFDSESGTTGCNASTVS
jgi:prepilin-type N-terminal cleavage/methylation domain-containing protein